MFDQQRQYDAKSPEAMKLNRAVAEYISMDQVPIYTVEKPGFKQLIKQLNPRYALPSRNHFMYSEIPELYNTTKQKVLQQLQGNPYFSCTTDLWTSRAASSFMAVTLQFITESWDMQSWCLGCVGLHSEHTGDSLREALEEIVQESWKLDTTKMAAITTDNASNNKKAFQQHFTWVPCFGHNLHLAINKGLDIDSVSGALSRLRKTVAAFTRSPKMTRQLKKKQKDLKLPEHRLIHDEPTRWDSTFEMVDRFTEQQQAVSAVLAEDRKKWYLMPKDSDITILETVKEVLSPLSSFTDALSGEKHTTLSSVLPLTWKIYSTLTIEDTSRHLERQLKQKIGDDLKHRYEDRNLQLVLNTATFLDPRFKDSFTTLKEELKQHLIVDNMQGLHTRRVPSLETSPPSATQPTKKSKTDLKGLLSNIQGERKKQHGDDTPTASTDEDPESRLRNELTLYETMPEQSAEEDPLNWWK
ncbi:PREDICTED: zinc finger BED domain-containing protein 1-like, partial [Cyprinodon variegatus]|uniref:zinc finger BED domain-containing protein 1-like n=1 Tax=Cyprinodon variegatus TaxID=28743 RepID=UPI000742C9F3